MDLGFSLAGLGRERFVWLGISGLKVLSSLSCSEQDGGEDRDEGQFRAKNPGGELFENLQRSEYPSKGKCKKNCLPNDLGGFA